MESNLAPGLSVSLKDLAVAFDPDLRLREGSTMTCQRSSPPLASLAVTHVNQYWIAICYGTQ
jgi:hypothetical protein